MRSRTRLVVARDRDGGEGEVGIAQRVADRGLRLALDLLDAVDRVGARHLDDRFDEMGRADHAHAQPLDADHAGHAEDRGLGLSPRAFRRAIEQRLHRRAAMRRPSSAIITATAMAAAASPHQKPRPARIRPTMTANEPSTSEAKCSASAASAWLRGLARGTVQRPRPPEIHGDVDHQHDERNGRNGRRRRALAQPALGLRPRCRRPAHRVRR